MELISLVQEVVRTILIYFDVQSRSSLFHSVTEFIFL